MRPPAEHFAMLHADLRHGLRLFAKSPGFTSVGLLVIAIGISATTTIFSLINAVLIRSLPYGEPEHLVYMWTPNPRLGDLPREWSPPFADVLDWRKMSHSFAEITALEQAMFVLADGGEAVRIAGARVLGNFFRTLQASPQLGRAIEDRDESPGRDDVVVISNALWRSRFGGNLSVLGKTIHLNGRGYSIIGVMPSKFGYPHSNDFPLASATVKRTEIWLPIALSSQQLSDRTSTSDVAIGRLRPGVTLQQAQSEMTAIEKHLEPLYPEDLRGFESLLIPFIKTAVGPVQPLMRLLMGAVLMVLLIACSNVANLLLARAAGRVHEIGIRTALGAERSRLIRQMLTESLLLATAGGLLGTFLSFAALQVVASLNPGDIPRFEETSLDGRVLLFAVSISLLSGLLSGVLPALSASRLNVADLLRQGGSRGLGGFPSRVRNGLVVSEVALSVVLLAGAGLLIRSYLKVQGEDKGFASSALTMKMAVDYQSRNSQQRAAMFRDSINRIRALPGIQSAGAIDDLPLGHLEDMTIPEMQDSPNRINKMVAVRLIAGEYFRAMQIRLIAGRFLNDGDFPESLQTEAQTVLVSESFARLYFPERPVIGRQVRINHGPHSPWSTIVGVVADVRHVDLEQGTRPTVYQPSWLADVVAIRTTLPRDSVITSVRKILAGIDPGIALDDVESMGQRVSEAISHRRFQTVLLASFAGIAVFLALAGLYGLLSFAVRQRTAEIGVRMALGASPGAILGMIVRSGLTLAAAGLAIGLIAAFAVTRWIASLLYGVNAADPVTFIAVPIFILAVAVVACLVPASKAARIDPVEALRWQ
jgi:predicted permease